MQKCFALGLAAWALVAVPAYAQQTTRTPQGPQEMGSGQTDQTVPVKKGMRLDVNELGGEIVVKTWDKDAVRIKAQHSRTDTVKIDALETVVRVRTGSVRGRPHAVDFEITAPTWMPLTLGGQYADVTVEGAQGDVTVETNHGDINVKGGSGFISLKTVHGVVVLEGAKGRSEVRSVNEAVRLVGVSGDTYVETNNGRITFEKMAAKNVEASTLNDDVIYEGALDRDGVYRLSTHNGNILMGVPEASNATINVRTFNGGFSTSLTSAKVEEIRKNRRYVVVLGNGGGRVDLESFAGSIRVRKPEEIRMRATTPRERLRFELGDHDWERPNPQPKPIPRGEGL